MRLIADVLHQHLGIFPPCRGDVFLPVVRLAQQEDHGDHDAEDSDCGDDEAQEDAPLVPLLFSLHLLHVTREHRPWSAESCTRCARSQRSQPTKYTRDTNLRFESLQLQSRTAQRLLLVQVAFVPLPQEVVHTPNNFLDARWRRRGQPFAYMQPRSNIRELSSSLISRATIHQTICDHFVKCSAR